jgi:glycosyltransferase involved in cell wall biosynthesis
MEHRISVIVSTYNQPDYLRRALIALGRQSRSPDEILVADDGSTEETANMVTRFAKGSTVPVRHIWQEDRGFRKTAILNKALMEAAGNYLVFIDGDCIAHPDFIKEHVTGAERGHYLNGSLVRLNQRLTERLTEDSIVSGRAFSASWLIRHGYRPDRRFLRLSLGRSLRGKLNEHSPTRLYWLGSNSSCFRDDAIAVNGFDNRFTYGFEDADFGNRMAMRGITAKTVRWTAVVLHLWHKRPWWDQAEWAENRRLMDENQSLGRFRAVNGLAEIRAGDADGHELQFDRSERPRRYSM